MRIDYFQAKTGLYACTAVKTGVMDQGSGVRKTRRRIPSFPLIHMGPWMNGARGFLLRWGKSDDKGNRRSLVLARDDS
jgi:hypothetical protein